MQEALKKFTVLINNLSLPLLTFLLPLFFLPLTTDFFSTAKLALLTTVTSLVLISWCINLLTSARLRLTLSPATIPLLLLALVFIISTAVQSSNNLVFGFMGRSSLYLSLIFLTIALTSTAITPTTIAAVYTSLSLSTIITSLVVIFQYFGLTTALNIDFLSSKSFNTLGGPLPFITFVLVLLPAFIYLTIRHQQKSKRPIFFLAAALSIFALLLALTFLLPKDNQPTFLLLPFTTGWTIAVDMFKSWRTAFLGVGPENFVTAFSLLKPISFNSSPFWNIRFSVSSNEYLTILTTTGLISLLLFFFAQLRTFAASFRRTTSADHYLPASRLILLTTIIFMILVPTTITLLFLSFLAIILIVASLKLHAETPPSEADVNLLSFKLLKSNNNKKHTTPAPILPAIITLVSFTLIIGHGYFRTRAYAADMTFLSSLKAAANNLGTQTYNLQIKAIDLYPYDPAYRIAYSQTNLALANAIATKKDPTDQDRSNITQLIQQAIREAKLAATLSPRNPATWENLGSVYRQLINLAEGADQWTIAAYTQAISLDPLNPSLRLALGGVYYSMNNYDQASILYQQAVAVKNNWANAHYNLATVYKDKGQFDLALQEMRIVVGLLPATSPDYQKAQDELKDLESKVKTSSTTPSDTDEATSELSKPSPIPTAKLKPITLPEGSGPDTPSSEQSASPSASQ